MGIISILKMTAVLVGMFAVVYLISISLVLIGQEFGVIAGSAYFLLISYLAYKFVIMRMIRI